MPVGRKGGRRRQVGGVAPPRHLAAHGLQGPAVAQQGGAARACGKGAFSITVEHVLPNIASVLIVQATIRFAIAILAEAALSYLGLGTQPPQPSWGRIPLLAKARPIAAGNAPMPLPAGAPLKLGMDVDAFMAGQRSAAVVVLHDGKLRLERYGLGFDATGRWTSFSVAKSM
eukprot:gene9125-11203_t